MTKIIAAGGLVVNEKNEFLMMLRRGYWDLPKGKLDEGETIEACAIREVKEEIGLSEVILEKFICKTYHQYYNHWINDETEKETWWYLMKASSSEILTPQTEEDIEQVIWVTKNELGQYLQQTYPSIKEVFQAFKLL